MSVINQMLKDLEQRRAQGFDGEAGVLNDPGIGAGRGGRKSSLPVVVLLLLVLMAILGWVVWQYFAVDKSTPQVEKQVFAPVPTVIKPVAAEASSVIPVFSKAVSQQQVTAFPAGPSPVNVDEPQRLARQEPQRPAKIETAKFGITGVTPSPVSATGRRETISIHGNGFTEDSLVVVEWTNGRGFKQLDPGQVRRVSASEIQISINPGTHADSWTVMVQRPVGDSTERYAFEVVAYDDGEQMGDKLQGVELPGVVRKTQRSRSPTERAEIAYAGASKLLQAGSAYKAEQELRNALALDARHIKARELLAGLLFRNGQLAEAGRLLEQGRVLHPTQTSFALLLARILMDQGREDEAIAVLESLRPSPRTHSDYYALLAALYQRTGKHSRAITVYQGLVDVYPGRAVWWMGLGISLQSLDRAGALKAYRRAAAGTGLQPELQKFVRQRIRLLESRG